MDAILQFTVTNQEIERTDEFTVVEGSENYLQAHFTFTTPDWDGMIKTGVFINEDGTMYPSLCKDDTCDVPPAWLKEQKGAVGVIGSDGTAKITTYAAKVRIRANGYTGEDIEEDTRTYFDQLLEAFANKYLETEEQAKLAQRWAVGLEDKPETLEDNAKYYAGQAHADALRAELERTEVIELSEHVAAVGRQVDEDKQAAGQYKEDAAQSALKAVLSESNAKASETDAQAAQEAAESAETQAGTYAAQTSSDRNAVEQAKSDVYDAKQEVSEKKEYVEQAVGSFELLHQQAVADVNNAGKTQTERVEEAGDQAVTDINTAGNTQVNNVNSAGQKAIENIGNGVDDTLKVKGKAADAAATGKAVEELKGDLSGYALKIEIPKSASDIGAEAAGAADGKVSAHNTAGDAHSDIRLLVQGLTDRLNALADSDDDTLDQMSEVVAYIKSNKSLIDAITTGKVSVTDIIDNLTTNVSNKPLSAAQGVKLKALIDAIVVPTKLSELQNDSGYAKTTDIPDKLPNPQKLIFSGAVTAEYDGSGAVTVTIPEGSGGSGGTWNLLDHFTVKNAILNYEIPLQEGAKEYGIYWGYTNDPIPQRSIMTSDEFASYGIMFRCTTNETFFARVYNGPNNILVAAQNIAYSAARFTNGGTYIGSGNDFPSMTLTTNIVCKTQEIWVYWR